MSSVEVMLISNYHLYSISIIFLWGAKISFLIENVVVNVERVERVLNESKCIVHLKDFLGGTQLVNMNMSIPNSHE